MLGDDIKSLPKSLPTLQQFDTKLVSFIRPPGHSMYRIHDIKGTKPLTKLRVEFSDLRSHRFKHNFNCSSPLCSCRLEEEVNSHCFIRCTRYQHIRIILLSNILRIIGSDISILPREYLSNIILYGSNVYNKITNKLIPIETLEYIIKSECFIVLEAFHDNLWYLLCYPTVPTSRLSCDVFCIY